MARVTVEDCLDKVENRFELVLLATKRARQLEGGKEALVDWENDKPTVVALREIEENKVSFKSLEETARLEAEAARVHAEEAAQEETMRLIEETGRDNAA